MFRIDCFLSPSLFLTKKELFCFFDTTLLRGTFPTTLFSDRFDLSYSEGVLNEYTNKNGLKGFYRTKIIIYVSALYIIKGRDRFVVDYEKIINEYCQSRKLNNLKTKNQNYEWRHSTHKHRLRMKNRMGKKRTYKKEISDTEEHILNGIRIKKSRLKMLKFNINGSDQYFSSRKRLNKFASWKNKKTKSQWKCD